MTGFEGSFLGATDKISAQAVMECKICWTPYDPAEGDDFRQIEAGTAFADLPGDWTCPNCGAPSEQFMVLDDPGADGLGNAAAIAEVTDRLVADFTEVWHSTMRGLPIVNKALKVEAVGFRRQNGQILGVLISPWFMNLILLPDGEDWTGLKAGVKEVARFPSGDYEFLHNTRDLTGGYKACSLFSPMADFTSQKDAVEVANAVMAALFDPAHRAETDRAADIRAAREAEPATVEDEREIEREPSRRAIITGSMSGREEAR